MTLCYRFLFFSTGTPLLPAQNCGLIFPLSDNNLECGNENCVCRVVGLQCVCVCVYAHLFSVLLCHSFVQCAEPVSTLLHCLQWNICVFFVQFFFHLFFLKKDRMENKLNELLPLCFDFATVKEKWNELLLLCFWFCYTVEQFIVLLCMRSFFLFFFFPLLIRKLL